MGLNSRTTTISITQGGQLLLLLLSKGKTGSRSTAWRESLNNHRRRHNTPALGPPNANSQNWLRKANNNNNKQGEKKSWPESTSGWGGTKELQQKSNEHVLHTNSDTKTSFLARVPYFDNPKKRLVVQLGPFRNNLPRNLQSRKDGCTWLSGRAPSSVTHRPCLYSGELNSRAVLPPVLTSLLRLSRQLSRLGCMSHRKKVTVHAAAYAPLLLACPRGDVFISNQICRYPFCPILSLRRKNRQTRPATHLELLLCAIRLAFPLAYTSDIVLEVHIQED